MDLAAYCSNSDDDIHSLLGMCIFCEDVWEAAGEAFTALSELTGLNRTDGCYARTSVACTVI